MSAHEDIPSASTIWLAQSRVDRAIGWVAVSGGILALAVAALVTLSVLGRWLLSQPIEGDFEFVRMATAIAIFSFLPYTQVQRGNILVDSFTNHLSVPLRAALDCLWDLTFAGIALLIALGLWTGATEALRSRETTMQLQIVVWPAIGYCAVLALLLAVASAISALRIVKAAR
jgi:TRAP-type C4-dicarboxylate transport system permease small subunit